MAGINFGILQPIQPTNRTVATIQPQASGVGVGIGDLANGILKGAEVGSSLKSQSVAREAAQQKMGEDAALFPGQLQRSNNATEASNMALEGLKQDAQDTAKLRSAAMVDPDHYRQALYKIDPNKGQAYDLTVAKTQKAISDVAKVDADTSTAMTKNYNQIVENLGTAASTALQMKDPKLQQAAWNFAVQGMGKQSQIMAQQIMPQGFSNDGGAAIVKLATNAHNKTQIDALEKNPSELAKNGFALQKVNQRIQTAIQNKQQPEMTDLQVRDGLVKAMQSDPKAKQGPSPEDGVQKEINSNDAKEMKAADDASTPLKTFQTDVNNVNSIMKTIPSGFTGKLVDLTKANINSSDVQVLQHHFASMGYLAKTVMANQSAGMRLTTAELTQLNKIVAGTDVNWDSIKRIMTDMQGKVDVKAHDNWSVSNRVRSGGNKDSYSKWLAINPEPYNPNKAKESSGYQHQGQDVPNEAFQRARQDHPGMKDEEIAAKFGLTKKGTK